MRRACLLLALVACESTFYQPKDTADTGRAVDTDGDDTGDSHDSDTGDDSGDTEDSAETGDTDTGLPVEATDFTVTGPHEVFTWSRTLSGASCAMDYDVYAPQNYEGTEIVILSHGFMRTKANMAGWAQHLASWGLTVVTPNLCSIYDHATNGQDLVKLTDAVTTGAAIYAGHSAGGLASMIAASQDPSTRGVLGLDLVDAFSLGVSAAGSVSAPVAGLVGISSSCNSKNNGLDVYRAAPDAQALYVTEADHCDFENPTDTLCQFLCPGTNLAFSDAEIQVTLKGLVTSWIVWRWGLDATGEMYWTFGEDPYLDMLSDGAIDPV